MQFVEVGVPHEIVQAFMHVNVGITSFYMMIMITYSFEVKVFNLE
jgi:hypothetical protein